MEAVRVVATVQFPSVEVADQALAGMVEAFRPKKAEEGCLQYELFRSIEDPSRATLHELWASKALYDKHWREQCEREGTPDANTTQGVSLEFYVQKEYVVLDGIWQPVDEAARMTTIRWA